MRSQSGLGWTVWWLAALAPACSGDDGAALVVPPIDTEFALYGTAPAGRALSPPSIRIVRTDEVLALKPEVIAGTDIDMVFAGLDPADLPASITPADLVLVRANDDFARPLPTLHDPHVLDVPSPSEAPTPLVPIEGPGILAARTDERDARYRTMLSDVALRSPCVELTAPILVTAPRLPADLVSAMREMSDGSTIVAFTTTSTIMVGIVPPGAQTLEVVAVPTGTVALEAGENATVKDLGNREVDIDGRKWPAEFILNFGGNGFGSVGAVYRFDPARRIYVEDTPPIPDTYPRVLYGIRHLQLEGVDQLCTFGGAQGSDRRAAIWCVPDGSTTWTATDFGRSFGITSIIATPGERPVATDLAGSVWELDDRGWRPVFESSVNANCDPLCANFGATWFDARATDRLAILGGTKAQLLYVTRSGGGVQTSAPAGLSDALFAEERFGADTALWFTAVSIDPSGAQWFGTTRPELFRIPAGTTDIERICLPPDMAGSPISSIHAHTDGRLLLGMSPALFSYGRWR